MTLPRGYNRGIPPVGSIARQEYDAFGYVRSHDAADWEVGTAHVAAALDESPRRVGKRVLADGSEVAAPPAGSLAAQVRESGTAPGFWERFSWEPGTGVTDPAAVLAPGLPQPKDGEEFADGEINYLTELISANDERLVARAKEASRYDGVDLRNATDVQLNAYAVHQGLPVGLVRGLGGPA